MVPCHCNRATAKSRSLTPMRCAALLVPAVLLVAGCASTADVAVSKGEASSPAGTRAISSAAGLALQGRMRDALAELDRVAGSEFGARDAATRSCLMKRFRSGEVEHSAAHPGPFSPRVIRAYQDYWRAVLLNPESSAAEERRLQGTLARLVDLPVGSDANLVENQLKERFSGEGLHVLMGRTPPLLELIVWSDELRQTRTVRLPEGDQEVAVIILDQFASLGWSAYATCDRTFTGGWVKPDAVYAVRPGWKSLEDENFRISFLAHETQHFADNKRWHNLASWELEYRGKLAELALADKTLFKLLAAFASNQGDDPAVPHSYANKRVLRALRQELALTPEADFRDTDAGRLNRAAHDLLLRDSRSRR